MFDRIVKWLETADDRGYPPSDIRAAVAALYYHMVIVDDAIKKSEIEAFREIVVRQFDVTDQQAKDLFRVGKVTGKHSRSLFPFTTILNQTFDRNQRNVIVDHLIHLADSDGIRHPLEDDLLDHVRELLKLSP